MKRASLSGMCLVALMSMRAAGDPGGLFEQVMRAIGTPDRVREIQTVHIVADGEARGTLVVDENDPNDYPIRITARLDIRYARPGSLVIRAELGGLGTERLGLTPDGLAWHLDAGGTSHILSPEHARILRRIARRSLSVLPEPEAWALVSCKSAPAEACEGCDHLRLLPAGEDIPLDEWYDRDTHLLRQRLEPLRDDRMLRTTFSDYEDHDGIRVAMMRTYVADEDVVWTVRVRTIEFNTLAIGEFEAPEAVRLDRLLHKH